MAHTYIEILLKIHILLCPHNNPLLINYFHLTNEDNYEKLYGLVKMFP